MPDASPLGSPMEPAVTELKRSGLLAATVPVRLGGPGLSPSQIASRVGALAEQDGSLGQVPQSHLSISRWLFNEADPANTPEAQQYWADRLLGIQHHSGSSSDSSILFANAQIDSAAATAGGGPVVMDNGRLNGRKIFCTGSIYAEVIVVTARRPGEDRQTLDAFLPVDTTGLTVVDDWSALGQEFTWSGTVVFEDVTVPEGALRSFDAALTFPGYGAFAQLLHAAIDVGIATSALDAALELTRQDDPDPLTSHLAGELVAQWFAAEAVMEKAGRTLDELWASGGTDTSAEASLQVAAAKVTTAALTVDLASRIYELTGTRGTAGGSNLDRHWRDLRTHTLHERRRDKLATLECAALTGENPPAGPKF